MEYLMTYGWAILIIAIVLVAFFSLNLFNPYTFSPKASPGSCQILRPNGPGSNIFVSEVGLCNTNEIPQYVAQFNGASSYVNVGNVGGYISGFTVTAWVKPTNAILTNVETSIITKRNASTSTAGWAIGIGGTEGVEGAVVWRTFNGVNQYSIHSPLLGVSPNSWYFIAVTQNNGGANIYLNAANYSYSIPNPAVDPTPLDIGYYNGGASYFAGQISDVQIYNTSLSTSAINTLYAEGIGGAPIDLQHLVGWWPLNGNSNDYSGNGNNGVPTDVVFTSSWETGYSSP